MRQALNKVMIDGIVNEIDLVQRDKDGANYIAGKVTVLVEQMVGGKMELEEIPVNAYAKEYTKAGKLNKAYTDLQKLMENGVSVAAVGSKDKATKISIGGASILNNRFQGSDGKLVVTPVIRGSFFSEPRGSFTPVAKFENEIFIKGISEEEDLEGMPTGRLIVESVIVQYADNVDIIKFVIEDPRAIDYIKENWNQKDTVKVAGVIRYTTEIKITEDDGEAGFGEFSKETKKTIKEFIITTGSAGCLDDSKAYTEEEIIVALGKRREADEALLNTKKEADRGF